MTVGLAIITHNRSEYLAEVFPAAHELPIDYLCLIDTSSDENEYVKNCEIVRPFQVGGEKFRSGRWVEFHIVGDKGVGEAKNYAFNRLLRNQCEADWFFIGEDDIVPTDPQAITGYIDACERSGWEHLCFGPHGPLNQRPTRVENYCAIYPNIVGAWCVYSRRCIETVGMMDPVLAPLCQMEHVEHTVRIMQAGLTHKWPGCADALGSTDWLHEIPGSIENSSIGPDKRANMQDALDRFYEINPEGFRMLWPNGFGRPQW